MRKLLVANRGEIAARIIRTARRMGIRTCLVVHPADRSSVAREAADELAELQGDPAVSAYLDAQQIIRLAIDRNCDAIHPGYGFLSENAGFARDVENAGIVWIGPPADVIALMGDKVEARRFAQEHGVPLVPSIQEADRQLMMEQVDVIGFPLLVKAVAGGGGKGMRIVRDREGVEGAIEQAKREALRYFGDDRVYIERYIEQPRHIEVQVFADRHGNVVHLGERECSIQRRFQKLIEESPSAAINPELRSAMCEAAVKLARASGYRNAGTVEFILGKDGRFYFIEMNTRLQVEHPVTELVSGLDLVEWQLRVAFGERLSAAVMDARIAGHAIECRINVEDAASGFLPDTGQIVRYRAPEGEGIRIDSGVQELDHVTDAFDPMVAKLIVWGRDRDCAIRTAEAALGQFCVLGVETNIAYLRAILRHPDYVAGAIDTGFLENCHDGLLSAMVSDGGLDPDVAAAFVALSIRETQREIPALAALGAWKN